MAKKQQITFRVSHDVLHIIDTLGSGDTRTGKLLSIIKSYSALQDALQEREQASDIVARLEALEKTVRRLQDNKPTKTPKPKSQKPEALPNASSLDIDSQDLPFELCRQKNIAEVQRAVGVRVLNLKADKLTGDEIAQILNAENIKTSSGSDWTRSSVNRFYSTLREKLK